MTQANDELCENLVARVMLRLTGERPGPPTATYRLQFHRGFGFGEAIAVLPYLASLGVSHVYASPLLQALPGSEHGYDVCDHAHFDLELGGDEGFAAFCQALRQSGLQLILDVVPNHMAAHENNPWWRDVLENGPRSPYWDFFDIDPTPLKQDLRDKVLLPVLGQSYGQALESGELKVIHADGDFGLRYHDRCFPVALETSVVILSRNIDALSESLGHEEVHVSELRSIIHALGYLSAPEVQDTAAVIERAREKDVIRRRLRGVEAASDAVRDFIEANVDYYNSLQDETAIEALDDLLRAQPYRLSHWRTAADEINYRRFFDVNELAAICMERPIVFEAAHRRIMAELVQGSVAGLRIDHVDGLFAPDVYLWRLQFAFLAAVVRCEILADSAGAALSDTAGDEPARCPLGKVVRELSARLGLRAPSLEDLEACGINRGEAGEDPQEAPRLATAPTGPLLVLVEKILGTHEPMPSNWPVAGTTGYDFTHDCEGLFLEPGGWRMLQRLYGQVTGDRRTFSQVASECKSLILRMAMASELQMLAQRLDRISEQHRDTRDFTLNMLRHALREILVCFPVYRVYPGSGSVSDRDKRMVQQAVVAAKRRNPVVAPVVFDFIGGLLLLEHPEHRPAAAQQDREVFAGRFQQVTSPVMAKGVEDTAFYAHVPLASVNEVGSDPESPCQSVAAFHQSCCLRRSAWPNTMLASSTHDSKRTEDVRARLHVLSEVPGIWRARVQKWRRWHRRLRQPATGGAAIRAVDEYLFYQSAVGIWPLTPPTTTELTSITERLVGYMQKAIHEAKQVTSWISPNREYDEAVQVFVRESLRPSVTNRFLTDLQAFVDQVAPWGIYSSLARLTLKMTTPGFPDVYQGQEVWDFSLVDPDNRRPVDFAMRRALLHQLDREFQVEQAEELARRLGDHRLKLFVTSRLLRLRRSLPALFAEGDYTPLDVTGPAAEHLVAFLRRRVTASAADALLVVVPRLLLSRALRVAGEAWSSMQWPGPEELWAETTIDVPPFDQPIHCVFTDACQPTGGRVPAGQLLRAFPVLVGATPNSARLDFESASTPADVAN